MFNFFFILFFSYIFFAFLFIFFPIFFLFLFFFLFFFLRVGPGPFSQLRTCRTRVRPGSFSELRTCQYLEFGERNWPFSELRTCRTRVWPGSYSKLWTCQGSELGERNWPFSEPAKPGLYPFFLRTPNLQNQGYTRSFSEIRTETPNSGQKHNPGPSWITHLDLLLRWDKTPATTALKSNNQTDNNNNNYNNNNNVTEYPFTNHYRMSFMFLLCSLRLGSRLYGCIIVI